MPDLSLAQFVAHLGGIREQRTAHDAGELKNIRQLSAKLPGKSSVYRLKGTPVDELAPEVMSAGYSVTEDTFIHFLEQDLIAWTSGSTRGRVLRDIDATAAQADPAYLEHVTQAHNESVCKVCECPRLHPSHLAYIWEHDHLEARDVNELRGESRNALYLTLFHFIYQDRRYK